jgi:hypothetical protein
MNIIELICGMIIGGIIGYFYIILSESKKMKNKIKKDKLNKNKQFKEILYNIRNYKSEFKTRINDSVYIETDLNDYGKITLIYFIDLDKLSIYKKEIQNTYSQISLSDLKSKVFQIANDLLKEFPENSYYLSLIQNLNGLIETQKEPFFSNNLVVFDPTYHKINKESESIQNLDQELMNILIIFLRIIKA